MLLVAVLGFAFVPALSASATPPDPGAVTTLCRGGSTDNGWNWNIVPGQQVTVSETYCNRLEVDSGTVTLNGHPFTSGLYTTPNSGTAVITSDASFTWYSTRYSGFGTYTVQLAQPLADPPGTLLASPTTSIGGNPQTFSVTGTVPVRGSSMDHELNNDPDCTVEGGEHVYTPVSVYLSQAGHYTFRTVSTSPASNYNDPTLDSTPMNDPFLAVYRGFDATQPDANVVGCNDDYDNVADVAGVARLADDTLVEGHLPAFSATLQPGTYTLMLSTYCAITASDWVSGAANASGCNYSFTPGTESVVYQLWGPANSLTIVTPPTITSGAPTASISAGQGFSHALTSSSNAPATWSISAGALPAGLVLDPSTGIISGTPTTVGTYNYTVTVDNGAGRDSASYSQAVTAVAPHITSAAPTAALTVNAAFASTVTASGTGPVTFSVTNGTLPDGLTLDPASGIISGTPTTAGSYTYTVTATNSAGIDSQTDTQVVSAAPAPVTVPNAGAPQPTSTTTPSPSPSPSAGAGPVIARHAATLTAATGAPFAVSVGASGSGTLTWTVTAGSLPPGLMIDASTGVISGRPTTAGAYAFTVTVENGFGATATSYTLRVKNAAVSRKAPTIKRHPLSRTLTVGTAYSSTIATTGDPTRYRIIAGHLPKGLSLTASTGLIDGTPSVAGTASFEVQASNDVGTAHRTLTLTVAAPDDALPVVSG